MYDVIGDIHGHATELQALLTKLGYKLQQGVYHHPTRQVLFVGDFIDRGPHIRETLKIVRGMVEGGTALAVMGNHEYNAICFHEENPRGGHLRPHIPRNIFQHLRTLEEFSSRAGWAQWQSYIQWFKTLPLFLELPGLRVVHACWDPRHIGYLRQQLPDARLTHDFLQRSTQRGTPEYQAVEDTLKGKEVDLPIGTSFHDKDGNPRTRMRTRWWRNPQGSTYQDYYLEPIEALNSLPVDQAALTDTWHYQDDTPVFFGHYWLRGTPQILGAHAVCLDYSVAKGGELVAYRWNGEQELTAAGLVSV